MRLALFLLIMVSVILVMVAALSSTETTTILEPGDVLSAGEYTWSPLMHEPTADRYTITIDVDADREFDILLVNRSVLESDEAPYIFTPPPSVRSGLAGLRPVEWDVSRDEFDVDAVCLVKWNAGWDAAEMEDISIERTEVTTVNHFDRRAMMLLLPMVVIVPLVCALLVILHRTPKEQVPPTPPPVVDLQPPPYGVPLVPGDGRTR
jgi:hypothetical protein